MAAIGRPAGNGRSKAPMAAAWAPLAGAACCAALLLRGGGPAPHAHLALAAPPVPPATLSAIGEAIRGWGVALPPGGLEGLAARDARGGGHLAAACLELDVRPRLAQHTFYIAQEVITPQQCADLFLRQPRRACDYGVDLVCEHGGLVAVRKPWGMRPHLPRDGSGRPYRVHPEELTVHDWFRSAYPEEPCHICNRLDMATSGLMLVARSADVSRFVNRLFAKRRVEKTYQALVLGQPPPSWDEGVQLRYRIADTDGFARRVDAADGQDAETFVKVVRRGLWRASGEGEDQGKDRGQEPLEAALVEVRPKTGRRHQIRVHLAAAGHPILGDDAYGGNPWGERGGSYRMFLHALALELPLDGPLWGRATGEAPWRVEAPCDFGQELRGLEA